MFRDLSPGAISVRATFEETISLAKRHGFAGIDLPLGDPVLTANPEACRDEIKAVGLKWGGFGLPTEFRGDEATYKKDLDALKGHAAVARRAGCTRCVTWIMPCHNELDFKANLDQHGRRLKHVAKILADEGIRFGVEFVGTPSIRRGYKYPFVHSVEGILQLCDAIGSDAGVLLDCFHWYTSGGTADDITHKLKGKVVYVHVNDAFAGRSRDEQIDSERALPGDTGVIDIEVFLGCLRKINYDGPVAAEPFMQELGKIPADEAVKRTAASFKKIGL